MRVVDYRCPTVLWYREPDSNQPHTDFQSAALPDELSRCKLLRGDRRNSNSQNPGSQPSASTIPPRPHLSSLQFILPAFWAVTKATALTAHCFLGFILPSVYSTFSRFASGFGIKLAATTFAVFVLAVVTLIARHSYSASILVSVLTL